MSKEIQEYLESYVTKFDLWRHIRLSTPVTKIERDKTQRKWLVSNTFPDLQGATQITAFDRLIVATGANNKPIEPSILNSEVFQGDIIHSQQFKDPTKYSGKTFVVVGSGQTAADTVEFLRLARAKKLYLSHRRSFTLLPRMLAGKPTESNVTRRFLVNGARERMQNAAAADESAERSLDSLRAAVWPELKDHVAFDGSRERPLMNASLPAVCDSIAQNLISGAVKSMQAIDRISGHSSIVLRDGAELHDLDAIVLCSGNHFDFSTLLPAEYDPTNPLLAPEQFESLNRTRYYHDNLRVCRAYRHFISLQEPHSLAFLGQVVSKTTLGLFPFYDLISMALAQLWNGDISMPTQEDMQRDCDTHFSNLAEMLEKSEINYTALVHEQEYDSWLHEVAGTGIPERLSGRWGWRECWLWLTNRKDYGMLMDGLNSPHAMRLFATGKRQAWEDAREAIEKANTEIDEREREWKRLRN